MQNDSYEKLEYDSHIWIGRRRLVAFFMYHAQEHKMPAKIMNYYLSHSYNEQFGEPSTEAVLYNKVLAKQVLLSLQDMQDSYESHPADGAMSWAERAKRSDWNARLTTSIKLECTESARVDRIFLGKLFHRGATCTLCRKEETRKHGTGHNDTDCACYTAQSTYDEYTPFNFVSPQVWDYKNWTRVDGPGKTNDTLCGDMATETPRSFVLQLHCEY